jgi:N-acetylmuramoyl-L-alanine amidase
MNTKTRALIVVGALLLASPGAASAQGAHDLYTRALARERTLRDARRPPALRQIRNVVAAFETVVRRYPRSGYADNALWEAGQLSLLAYERFGESADKRTGIRVLMLLRSGYPSSSLAPRVAGVLTQFDEEPEPPETERPAVPAVNREPRDPEPEGTGGTSDAITIRSITRTSLDEVVRISIEMDRELTFRQEQLQNPRRLFFDLKGARPSAELLDSTLKFDEDVAREIRLGRHPNNTTRVVIDTEGVQSHSVFTLYNPYRVIIDLRRAAPVAVRRSAVAEREENADSKSDAVPTTGASTPEAKPEASSPAPLPSRPATTAALSAPAVPATNSNGQFSLARQLGLGVSRVVIDAGHGGHDPGARGNGINEAELTLDVALRLKKLLEKQPGVDVVLTRDRDVFIPLEERTAIANRENADLFLSIHANASRNTSARGIETYFLNFATNPEAEAVAARENSASGGSMHSLPSIVRAIALNNKIDESRDFAATVQKSMVQRVGQKNRSVRNLGVKQAPFVVLIGAGMPSVLAEISFVTNKQEGQLLKSGAYRQTIAEALQDAVLRYQKSLKAKNAIATRE